MDNKAFSLELEKRTLKFAVTIIEVSSKLPATSEGRVVRNQLTKSGTSIGANYREANRSRSKADFANKIKISESESSETMYWLEIVETVGWCHKDQIQLLKHEANELLAIFTSINNTLKKNKSQ
jgi:four helix bundle protein